MNPRWDTKIEIHVSNPNIVTKLTLDQQRLQRANTNIWIRWPMLQRCSYMRGNRKSRWWQEQQRGHLSDRSSRQSQELILQAPVHTVFVKQCKDPNWRLRWQTIKCIHSGIPVELKMLVRILSAWTWYLSMSDCHDERRRSSTGTWISATMDSDYRRYLLWLKKRGLRS